MSAAAAVRGRTSRLAGVWSTWTCQECTDDCLHSCGLGRGCVRAPRVPFGYGTVSSRLSRYGATEGGDRRSTRVVAAMLPWPGQACLWPCSYASWGRGRVMLLHVGHLCGAFFAQWQCAMPMAHFCTHVTCKRIPYKPYVRCKAKAYPVPRTTRPYEGSTRVATRRSHMRFVRIYFIDYTVALADERRRDSSSRACATRPCGGRG